MRLGHRELVGKRRQQVRARQHGRDSREMRHPAGNRFARSPAADAATLTGLVRLSPTRTARCGHRAQVSAAPFGEGRMSSRARSIAIPARPAASPATPCGRRSSRGHDRDVDLAFRAHRARRRLARRGPLGRYAGRFAAQPRQQMRKHGQHEIRRGDAKHSLRASQDRTRMRGDSTRWIPLSIGRVCSIRSSAKAVGCIRTPALDQQGIARAGRATATASG